MMGTDNLDRGVRYADKRPDNRQNKDQIPA